jgi:hypothetical protein
VTNPLFSTYRGGENRVTSSMMAVFERIDLALVRDLLAAATGAGDELRAVTFQNQVPLGPSVPDACIDGHFTWWFETKTVRGAYATLGHSTEQLEAHAALLRDDADALLFVVTPDAGVPAAVTAASAEVRGRIVWLSFARLAAAIEEISEGLFSEQTRFLLAELVALFEVDGLLSTDDTVIVAARSAWPEYQAIGAYVCQPDRPFRDDITHLGFYAEAAIQPVVARIRSRQPSVVLSAAEAARRRAAGEEALATVIEEALESGVRVEGQSYGIFVLSGLDDPETVHLEHAISNDTTAESGRVWAWTLSQRYTSLAQLRSDVRKTSEL